MNTHDFTICHHQAVTFIKVTNTDGKICWVNLSRVDYIKEATRAIPTKIIFSDGQISVRENASELFLKPL